MGREIRKVIPNWVHPKDDDGKYKPMRKRPPRKKYDATWFQMYETVSEGTPVSPPFPSLDALEDYLVNHGDFWDQRRGSGGWRREAAKSFCADGFACSMIVQITNKGTVILEPRDMDKVK